MLSFLTSLPNYNQHVGKSYQHGQVLHSMNGCFCRFRRKTLSLVFGYLVPQQDVTSLQVSLNRLVKEGRSNHASNGFGNTVLKYSILQGFKVKQCWLQPIWQWTTVIVTTIGCLLVLKLLSCKQESKRFAFLPLDLSLCACVTNIYTQYETQTLVNRPVKRLNDSRQSAKRLNFASSSSVPMLSCLWFILCNSCQ